MGIGLHYFPDTIDAKESEYLFIKPSGICEAGNGLYTSIIIYHNERISIFKGKILSFSEAAANAKKHLDAYFITLPNGKTLDPGKMKCYAKYANDIEYTKAGIKNNACITLDENNNVCLVALRDIMAGEEIFCSYGKRYWKNYNLKKI